MKGGLLRLFVAAAFVAACAGDGGVTTPTRSDPGGTAYFAIGTDPVTGASIETNQDDYVPGEMVHVVGRGWAPDETVTLFMTEEPERHDDVSMDVTADSTGTFSVHFYHVQEHDLGVTFTLTATGQTSGSRAVATFTDGAVQIHTNSSAVVIGTVNFTTYAGSTNCTTGPTTNGTRSDVSNANVGLGNVANDESVLVTAPAVAGFNFVKWTKDGTTTEVATASVCIPGTQTAQAWTANYEPAAPADVATTLDLTDDPDSPTYFGTPVTFTATLTPNTAAGTVNFYAFTAGQTCDALGGATALASAAVAGGTASYGPVAQAVGSHTITACYVPDAGFVKSEDSETHVVNQATTSLSVASNNDPSEFGENVTFTATVSVTNGSANPTGGTVNFAIGGTCDVATGTITGGTALSTSSAAIADDAGVYKAAVTVNDLAVGTHDIVACYGGSTSIAGSTGTYEDQDVDPKATTTSVAVSPSTQQYSDKVVFTATITPASVLGSTLTGNVQFQVDGSDEGAAQAITCGAVQCTATLTYTIGSPASPPTLAISAAFTSTNVNFDDSESTTDATLTVTKEDATVYDPTVSPGQILIGGGGSVTFKVRETNGTTATEKNPQSEKNDGLVAAGDISNAGVSVSAKGVLTNTNLALNCGAPSSNGSAGYAEILTVTCTFGPVNTADTYDVDIDVTGDYYTGEGAAIIQVTDPSAGFTTGGGWFWYGGVVGGDKVNFGFSAKSTQNRNNTIYQGGLLLIRHKANGDVVKIKSNVFDGYSIQNPTQQNPCGSATFSGKANYSVNGVSMGNASFVGYGRDCGEPGTSDAFGLYHALAPNEAATTTIAGQLVSSAKTLAGGNIQVPQPSGGGKK